MFEAIYGRHPRFVEALSVVAVGHDERRIGVLEIHVAKPRRLSIAMRDYLYDGVYLLALFEELPELVDGSA